MTAEDAIIGGCLDVGDLKKAYKTAPLVQRISYSTVSGALNLQDLKMTDHEKTAAGKKDRPQRLQITLRFKERVYFMQGQRRTLLLQRLHLEFRLT